MNKPSDPDCYRVEPGRLLAGEYPGSLDPAAARAKLDALLDAGIRTFIDLTEADEELDPYRTPLEEEARARGVTVSYRRVPIQDVSVPDVETMRRILRAIDDALAEGSPVYVHCWGGIGRTGTVVGCWLVEHGRAAAGEALAVLRDLRRCCTKRAQRSPETDQQRRFIAGWPALAASTVDGGNHPA